MIKVNAGQTVKVQIKRMGTITLVNSPSSVASLTVDGEVIAASHTGTQTYGPFLAGGKAVITATTGNVEYSRSTKRNSVKPAMVKDGAIVDAQGSAVGAGLSGTVQDGLLIVQHEGQPYALLPLQNGAVEADFVPRKGTLSQMMGIDGANGEIATVTEGGLAVLNGVAGGAQVFFPDNAGRTQVVLVPTSGYTGGTVVVGPEVQTLAVLWATQPLDRFQDPFPNIPIEFVGNRHPGRPFRVVADFSVNIGGLQSNVNSLSVNSNGQRTFAEFVLHTGLNRYLLLNQVSCSSLSAAEIGEPGIVTLGEYSGAIAPYAMGLGTSAIAEMPGAIAFGRPDYSFFSNYHILRLGGSTSGVNGTKVLLPNPDEEAWERNSFRFGQILGGAVFSVRLDIVGKTASEYARFIREFLIQRTNAGALTIVNPATPNNPSDILSASMTGASVALSINSALGALEVTVTGPNTAANVRWSCLATVHAVADF